MRGGEADRLIDALLAGDCDAFESFFELYFERVYAFALRRGARAHDAQELTAVVLEMALGSLDRASAARDDLDHWMCGLTCAAWAERTRASEAREREIVPASIG